MVRGASVLVIGILNCPMLKSACLRRMLAITPRHVVVSIAQSAALSPVEKALFLPGKPTRRMRT